MNKLLPLVLFAFQCMLSFFFTFFSYLVFALFDYKGGIDNFVGLTVFQPLFAALFSVLTLFICFIIGLPLRFNKKANAWWTGKIFIPIALIFIGLTMLIISISTPFLQPVTERIDGIELTTTAPNQFLSITGWFFMAFSALHLPAPDALKSKINNFLNAFFA